MKILDLLEENQKEQRADKKQSDTINFFSAMSVVVRIYLVAEHTGTYYVMMVTVGSFHSVHLPFFSVLCRFIGSNRFFERQLLAFTELYLVHHYICFAIPGGNNRDNRIAIPSHRETKIDNRHPIWSKYFKHDLELLALESACHGLCAGRLAGHHDHWLHNFGKRHHR